MPAWTALASTAKRIPWRALFVAGQQLYMRGRAFRDNLTPAERARLGEVIRKSKGQRANLSDGEVSELRGLVMKGVRGGP